MTDRETTEKPPLHMRLWRPVELSVMHMDMASEYGRARTGERWACLCGSLFGRGIMWPMWRCKQ